MIFVGDTRAKIGAKEYISLVVYVTSAYTAGFKSACAKFRNCRWLIAIGICRPLVGTFEDYHKPLLKTLLFKM